MKVVAMTYQAALGQGSTMSAELDFSENHAARKNTFVSLDNPESIYTPPAPSLDNDE